MTNTSHEFVTCCGLHVIHVAFVTSYFNCNKDVLGEFMNTIHTRNSQQDTTVYQNLLFRIYMKLNMFRATHRPSSGAQNCTSSLWFCILEMLLDTEFSGRCQRPATSMSNNLLRMQNQRLLLQF